MSAFCVAFAYATELSLATFSAAARFTGAATFALISDIAARSGSSSPARLFSSSRVSGWYCSISSAIGSLLLVGLADVAGLRGVGIRDRVVRQHVRRDCGVDRDRDVRVHQPHRGTLRKLLACEPRELLASERLELAHGVSFRRSPGPAGLGGGAGRSVRVERPR